MAGESGRAVVVVITDGGDNASWLSRQTVATDLRNAGVPIDVVVLDPDYRPLQPDKWPPG